MVARFLQRHNLLMNLIPFVFVGVGILFIVLGQVNQKERSSYGQTYVRALACMASVSPTRRTPDYVKDCYDKAEAATGQKVERFGDGQ